MKLKLISPTREKKYTWSEILKKGLDRAKLSSESFIIKELHCCFYHSRDYALEVQNLRCSDSLWNGSVSFRINGIIPVHASADGKLSIGWRCGCDRRHGGQFPQQNEADNPSWADYKKTETGHIAAWIGEGDSSENIDTISIKSLLTEKEEGDYWSRPRTILLGIVKELMTRSVFQCSDSERIIGAERK